jgi:hypothetical protein
MYLMSPVDIYAIGSPRKISCIAACAIGLAGAAQPQSCRP